MSRELKNEFAWSKTRDEVFRECLRKYWFQYYGFWGGWFENASKRAREIYILKQLQTRQMWAGDHVHRRIKHTLSDVRRGFEPKAVEKAVEATLEDMREDFKASRAGLYRQEPKRKCGLFEHEYKQDVPNEKWKENADHVALCVRNFYASEIFQRIRALPRESWLELEERSSFDLDGLKVYVQLDFAFREDSRIVIYDWKTGRADSGRNDLQLACYVLYAAQKWQVAPAQVTAVEFNLPSNQERRHEVDEGKLQSVKEHIRESAEEMLFPLTDPEHNKAEDEDAFEFTEDERACTRCNFVKVCPKFHQDG